MERGIKEIFIEFQVNIGDSLVRYWKGLVGFLFLGFIFWILDVFIFIVYFFGYKEEVSQVYLFYGD